MNREELNKFIGKGNLTVVAAMEKIDKNASGILFIEDLDGKLVGSLTDGDIRRWLIETGDLQARISKIMNTSPKYLYQADRIQAFTFMKKKFITALPILDVENKIIDICFLSDNQHTNEKVNTLNDVPVIIMAGGKGTRLYPYTKILPKPLIPIGDIPIIERIINRFCEFGVSQYYLTVNYKKGMIRSYFSDLKPEYEIEYIEETRPLGTAGSLNLIQQKFYKPVIVTNCDILINVDYSDIYRHHIASGNAMTIVSALKNVIIPYGVLHSGRNGVVESMEEKPKMSYFVNTGMYILNPEILKQIPKETFYHMTDLADALMKKGVKVGMYPISEEAFLDMGEFEEMRRMEKKLNPDNNL